MGFSQTLGSSALIVPLALAGHRAGYGGIVVSLTETQAGFSLGSGLVQ